MGNTRNKLARLRAWSYLRQQLGRQALGPAEALQAVVAVYSSHPTAPLSLLSRSKLFDAGRFSELEERREALRIPGMRESIFLAPADTAPRIFAATRQSMERHARRLRYAKLEHDEYERLKRRVLKLMREPIPGTALKEALGIEQVRVTTAVRIMAHEGLVLRLGSSLRTDKLRYVATEAWLGRPLEEADPGESLKWLAEAYLRSYGPARVEDFAWWSGISRRRAAGVLADVRVVDLGGGLLLPPDQRTAFDKAEPADADAVDLLPKWDAYTMGYAPDGRQRLVDDGHLAKAYTTAASKSGATVGDGLPLVLRDGCAVATWSHRFDGKRMVVEVTPFARGRSPARVYEHAVEEIARVLGAESCQVRTGA